VVGRRSFADRSRVVFWFSSHVAQLFSLGLFTMKKVFTILGAIFAVILVIIVIAAAIFIPRALKLDRDATAYIQSEVPKIVEHWNPQALSDRASPELLKVPKYKDEIDRYFEMFSKLGALKHLDAPKGAVYSGTYTGTGSYTVGNYTAGADFEKGKATIKMQLMRVGETWKINSFYIYSDVFLPPKA
jgi:hypothetical protein